MIARLVRMGLGVVVLTSCAAAAPAPPPHLEGHVTRFHVLDSTSKQFVILPTQSEESSLEFRSYAELVRQELQRRGWHDATYESADVLVFLQYQISRGRQVTFSYPIYGQVPTGTSTTTGYLSRGGGFSGTTTSDTRLGVVGEGTGRATVFDRAVELRMYAAPAYRDAKRWDPLYEGVLHSSGATGDLPPLMPAMLKGLLEDFPGKSGSTGRISVPLAAP